MTSVRLMRTSNVDHYVESEGCNRAIVQFRAQLTISFSAYIVCEPGIHAALLD